MKRFAVALPVLLLLAGAARLGGQIIDFETNGLRYQTLTRNGLTIMYARLAWQVRDYSVLQVAVSNGSGVPQIVRPEDFSVERGDGSTVPAVPVRTVVTDLMNRGGRSDVIRLVSAYEASLYGNPRYRATNGYEARRQNALAEMTSTKLKAAATASAIVFVQTKLLPGESTDGAVFYLTGNRPLGPGTLRVKAAGSVFEFPVNE
jgi:hypothetical protein